MSRRSLKLLRRIRSRWRNGAEYVQLGWRVRFGRDEQAPEWPPLAVIIQNFARPQNIGLIVRTALRCRFVDRVVLSNNNPEIGLAQLGLPSDRRLQLMQQDRRMQCGTRYDIAADLPHGHFMSLDDDVFLRPEQITALHAALTRRPTCPHGLFGQTWREVEGHAETRWTLKGVPLNHTGPVDVLNCVVAFTARHVQTYHSVLERIGRSGSDGIGPADDIVISASGSERPRCHDFGRVLTCASTDDPGIAAFLQPGVATYREGIFREVHPGV